MFIFTLNCSAEHYTNELKKGCDASTEEIQFHTYSSTDDAKHVFKGIIDMASDRKAREFLVEKKFNFQPIFMFLNYLAYQKYCSIEENPGGFIPKSQGVICSFTENALNTVELIVTLYFGTSPKDPNTIANLSTTFHFQFKNENVNCIKIEPIELRVNPPLQKAMLTFINLRKQYYEHHRDSNAETHPMETFYTALSKDVDDDKVFFNNKQRLLQKIALGILHEKHLLGPSVQMSPGRQAMGVFKTTRVPAKPGFDNFKRDKRQLLDTLPAGDNKSLHGMLHNSADRQMEFIFRSEFAVMTVTVSNMSDLKRYGLLDKTSSQVIEIEDKKNNKSTEESTVEQSQPTKKTCLIM